VPGSRQLGQSSVSHTLRCEGQYPGVAASTHSSVAATVVAAVSVARCGRRGEVNRGEGRGGGKRDGDLLPPVEVLARLPAAKELGGGGQRELLDADRLVEPPEHEQPAQ